MFDDLRTVPFTIKKPNFHGFDHNKVKENFEGNPIFVNEFCVKGEYTPVAVYYVAEPNRDKGHKPYLLLSRGYNGNILVRGMEEEEAQTEAYQAALWCCHCNTVIYSVNRHNFVSCHCIDLENSIAIDGGKDYTKVSVGSTARYKHVMLNLLTDTVLSNEKD